MTDSGRAVVDGYADRLSFLAYDKQLPWRVIRVGGPLAGTQRIVDRSDFLGCAEEIRQTIRPKTIGDIRKGNVTHHVYHQYRYQDMFVGDCAELVIVSKYERTR